jgi:hypothetical protein
VHGSAFGQQGRSDLKVKLLRARRKATIKYAKNRIAGYIAEQVFIPAKDVRAGSSLDEVVLFSMVKLFKEKGKIMKKLQAVMAHLGMVLLASAAHAHGGLGMQDNKCVLRIGPDLMFFTGYQKDTGEEFCEDIPTPGQTGFALDMRDKELLDMVTEIRIIKDDGSHTKVNGLPLLTDEELGNRRGLDSVTIVYVPPKKYPRGTLTFEYNFPGDWRRDENGKFIPVVGKFIGIVMVTNGRGQTYVSQFPFSVVSQRPKRLDPE